MNDIGGSGDGDSNWFSAESTTRDSSYFSGLLAAIKAGLQDVRRLPVLVLSTAIVVLIATLSVLASPSLRLLTDAADAYVTKNSELIVVIEPGPHVDRVVDQIAEMVGVGSVVLSTEEDLEAVGSGFLERGDSYTIRPDGIVDVALLQARLTSTFSEVAAARQTVGLESDLAVELMGMLLPWLAGGLIVAGLLMIAYLALMVGRIRAGEGEIMGLIGSTPLQTWLRLGTVTFVPTVFVILVTSAGTAILVPRVADLVLPFEAAMHVTTRELLRPVGFLLIGGMVASVVAGILGTRASRG